MSTKLDLRAGLVELSEKTASGADLPAGYWGADTDAGKRQLADDASAGRLDWRAARQFAARGLQALDAGDLELATSYARAATAHYIAALEKRTARLRPSDAKALNKPAGKRGRPLKNK